MQSSPSEHDQRILDSLKRERTEVLQAYFDREVQLKLLQIFFDINNEVAAVLIGGDTEDEKLKSLLGHGGLWRDIDPLLEIDRLELFKNSVEKVSERLKGAAWENYQKEAKDHD